MEQKGNKGKADELNDVSIEKAIRISTNHNCACVGTFELVFTFGYAFCLPFTIVPAYLLYLQAPKTLIQTVMTVLTVLTVFQIWGTKLNHHPQRKRRVYMLWNLSTVPWLIFGIMAFFTHTKFPLFLTGTIFVLCVLVGSIASQLASPGYSEMMFQNIDKARRGRFGSILNSSIGFGGLAGAWVAAMAMSLLAKPQNYHLAFIIGSLFIICASLALSAMHDHHARNYEPTDTYPSLRSQLNLLWRNVNYRVFLLFYSLMAGSYSLAPLFISCSADRLGLDRANVNFFSISYYCGVIVLGSSIPLLADRFGFRITGILQALLMAAAFALVLFFPSAPLAFHLAYMLYAGASVLSFIVLANLGHEMVPEVPSALIIAIGGTLIMPVAMCIGPLSGMFVDLYGDGGYLAAFVAGFLLNAIAGLGLILVVREPRTGEELYIRLR